MGNKFNFIAGTYNKLDDTGHTMESLQEEWRYVQEDPKPKGFKDVPKMIKGVRDTVGATAIKAGLGAGKQFISGIGTTLEKAAYVDPEAFKENEFGGVDTSVPPIMTPTNEGLIKAAKPYYKKAEEMFDWKIGITDKMLEEADPGFEKGSTSDWLYRNISSAANSLAVVGVGHVISGGLLTIPLMITQKSALEYDRLIKEGMEPVKADGIASQKGFNEGLGEAGSVAWLYGKVPMKMLSGVAKEKLDAMKPIFKKTTNAIYGYITELFGENVTEVLDEHVEAGLIDPESSILDAIIKVKNDAEFQKGLLFQAGIFTAVGAGGQSIKRGGQTLIDKNIEFLQSNETVQKISDYLAPSQEAIQQRRKAAGVKEPGFDRGEISFLRGGTTIFKDNKFKEKHIGGGEGSDAFGWGINVTEEWDIAAHYARARERESEQGIEMFGKKYDKQGIHDLPLHFTDILTLADAKNEQEFYEYRNETIAILENRIKEVEGVADAWPKANREEILKDIHERNQWMFDGIDLLNKLNFGDVKTVTSKTGKIAKGVLFKGKERGKDYQIMPWDKSISKEQINIIKEGLNKIKLGKDVFLDNIAEYDPEDNQYEPPTFKNLLDLNPTGKDIYQTLTNYFYEENNKGLLDNEDSIVPQLDEDVHITRSEAKMLASKWLDNIGIHGNEAPIGYLSRNRHNDTELHNYFIFNEKNVDIESWWDLAGNQIGNTRVFNDLVRHLLYNTESKNPYRIIPTIGDEWNKSQAKEGQKIRVQYKNGVPFEADILKVDGEDVFLDDGKSTILIPKKDLRVVRINGEHGRTLFAKEPFTATDIKNNKDTMYIVVEAFGKSLQIEAPNVGKINLNQTKSYEEGLNKAVASLYKSTYDLAAFAAIDENVYNIKRRLLGLRPALKASFNVQTKAYDNVDKFGTIDKESGHNVGDIIQIASKNLPPKIYEIIGVSDSIFEGSSKYKLKRVPLQRYNKVVIYEKTGDTNNIPLKKTNPKLYKFLTRKLLEINTFADEVFKSREEQRLQAEANRKIVAQPNKKQGLPVGWARFNKDGYEVSSAGDSRFSALNAKLKDGRTIEEAYQLDIKGFRSKGYTKYDLFKKDKDGKFLIKGQPPVNKITKEQSWKAYKSLWEQWARENPELIEELRAKSSGKKLTDKFASTDVSQARALYEILSPKQVPKIPQRKFISKFPSEPIGAIQSRDQEELDWLDQLNKRVGDERLARPDKKIDMFNIFLTDITEAIKTKNRSKVQDLIEEGVEKYMDIDKLSRLVNNLDKNLGVAPHQMSLAEWFIMNGSDLSMNYETSRGKYVTKEENEGLSQMGLTDSRGAKASTHGRSLPNGIAMLNGKWLRDLPFEELATEDQAFTEGRMELEATSPIANDLYDRHLNSALAAFENGEIDCLSDTAIRLFYEHPELFQTEYSRPYRDYLTARINENVKRGVEIEYKERITREDLKKNPKKVYLFGDNLLGQGFGGQAKEMRGEPNAIGIPTKKKPTMEADAFMTDKELVENKKAIDKAFDKIPDGATVVIPKAGLGTGLAKLNTSAPLTFEYLTNKLKGLKVKESEAVFQLRREKEKGRLVAKDVARTNQVTGEVVSAATQNVELTDTMGFNEYNNLIDSKVTNDDVEIEASQNIGEKMYGSFMDIIGNEAGSVPLITHIANWLRGDGNKHLLYSHELPIDGINKQRYDTAMSIMRNNIDRLGDLANSAGYNTYEYFKNMLVMQGFLEDDASLFAKTFMEEAIPRLVMGAQERAFEEVLVRSTEQRKRGYNAKDMAISSGESFWNTIKDTWKYIMQANEDIINGTDTGGTTANAKSGWRFYPNMPAWARIFFREVVSQMPNKIRDKESLYRFILGHRLTTVERKLAVEFIAANAAKNDLNRQIPFLYTLASQEGLEGKDAQHYVALRENEVFNRLKSIKSAIRSRDRDSIHNIIDSVRKYKILTSRSFDEQVRRGKAEADQKQEFYFHHQVEKYTEDWMIDRVFYNVSKISKTPIRGYTVSKKLGEHKFHEPTFDSMIASLMSPFVDNLIEDTVNELFDTANVTLKYIDDNSIIDEDGNKVIRPDSEAEFRMNKDKNGEPTGWLRVGSRVEIEGVPHIAVTKTYYTLKFDHTDPTQTVVDGNQETFLIPESVNSAINSLFHRSGRLVRTMNLAVKTFKRLAIMGVWPVFQINNMLGDLLQVSMLAENRAEILSKVPFALKYNLKKWAEQIYPDLWREADFRYTEKEKYFEDWADRHGIINANAIAEIRSTAKGWNPLSRFIKDLEISGEARENIIRVAFAKSLYDQLQYATEQQKEDLLQKYSWVPHILEGNTTDARMASLARTLVVDYMRQTENYKKTISAGFFPFGHWFFQSATMTIKKWYSHPLSMTMMLSFPSLFAAVWNNSDDDRERMERELPPERANKFHLNFVDKETGSRSMYEPQIPSDILPLVNIPGIIVANSIRYFKGEINGTEALKNIGIDTLNVNREIIIRLTNFLLRFGTGLVTHQDPFDRAKVFPRDFKAMEDTGVALHIYYYFMKCGVPVAGNYLNRKAKRLEPDAFSKTFESWTDGYRILGFKEDVPFPIGVWEPTHLTKKFPFNTLTDKSAGKWVNKELPEKVGDIDRKTMTIREDLLDTLKKNTPSYPDSEKEITKAFDHASKKLKKLYPNDYEERVPEIMDALMTQLNRPSTLRTIITNERNYAKRQGDKEKVLEYNQMLQELGTLTYVETLKKMGKSAKSQIPYILENIRRGTPSKDNVLEEYPSEWKDTQIPVSPQEETSYPASWR